MTNPTVEVVNHGLTHYPPEDRRQDPRNGDYPLQVLATHIESAADMEALLANAFSGITPEEAAWTIAKRDVRTEITDPSFNAITQLIKLADEHYDKNLKWSDPNTLEFSIIYSRVRIEAEARKRAEEARLGKMAVEETFGPERLAGQ